MHPCRFDVRELFISFLAFLLGIPVSRIQIVNVVAGSTVLNTLIYADATSSAHPIANPNMITPGNIDDSTRAILGPR